MTALSNPVTAGTSSATAEARANPRPKLAGHMPALDGIRGLAVLMVLVFHFVGQMLPTNWVERAIVGVTKYGSFGVDLFFVLSGFLITGILYEARDKPHYFRNFYMRRVLRIFPLYYGVLVLVFFVAPLIPPLRGPTLDYLLDRQAWAWLYAVNIYIAGHRRMVLLLSQPFLVARHRGALLPLLAARGVRCWRAGRGRSLRCAWRSRWEPCWPA